METEILPPYLRATSPRLPIHPLFPHLHVLHVHSHGVVRTALGHLHPSLKGRLKVGSGSRSWRQNTHGSVQWRGAARSTGVYGCEARNSGRWTAISVLSPSTFRIVFTAAFVLQCSTTRLGLQLSGTLGDGLAVLCNIMCLLTYPGLKRASNPRICPCRY